MSLLELREVIRRIDASADLSRTLNSPTDSLGSALGLGEELGELPGEGRLPQFWQRLVQRGPAGVAGVIEVEPADESIRSARWRLPMAAAAGLILALALWIPLSQQQNDRNDIHLNSGIELLSPLKSGDPWGLFRWSGKLRSTEQFELEVRFRDRFGNLIRGAELRQQTKETQCDLSTHVPPSAAVTAEWQVRVLSTTGEDRSYSALQTIPLKP